MVSYTGSGKYFPAFRIAWVIALQREPRVAIKKFPDRLQRNLRAPDLPCGRRLAKHRSMLVEQV